MDLSLGTKLGYVHAPGKELPGGRLLYAAEGWTLTVEIHDGQMNGVPWVLAEHKAHGTRLINLATCYSVGPLTSAEENE